MVFLCEAVHGDSHDVQGSQFYDLSCSRLLIGIVLCDYMRIVQEEARREIAQVPTPLTPLKAKARAKAKQTGQATKPTPQGKAVKQTPKSKALKTAAKSKPKAKPSPKNKSSAAQSKAKASPKSKSSPKGKAKPLKQGYNNIYSRVYHRMKHLHPLEEAGSKTCSKNCIFHIYQATACSRRPPRDRTLALALLYVSLSLKP